MRHLRPDELIDLADGTRLEAAAPHLLVCAGCRRQVVDARAMLSAAAAADVPEPSPLFWDHFSARVHQAVAAERAPRRVPWFEIRSWSTWSRIVVPLSVGALVVLILAAAWTLSPGRLSRNLSVPPEATTAADAGGSVEPAPLSSVPLSAVPSNPGSSSPGSLSPGLSSDDPPLELVADLTEDMDWDTARDAGLLPRRGALYRAVNHLDDVERRELQRLLKEELARGNN